MCWQQSSSNRRAQERCVVPVRWGVQLPSVCMHSNDYFGADAEPIAAHGSSELLARIRPSPHQTHHVFQIQSACTVAGGSHHQWVVLFFTELAEVTMEKGA